jgi:pyruvyltransferase
MMHRNKFLKLGDRSVAMLTRKKSELNTAMLLFVSQLKNRKVTFLRHAGAPGFLREPNIGDALPPYIYRKLSGESPPPNLGIGIESSRMLPSYMTVGSILQFADSQTIVWGSGFDAKGFGFGYKNWREVNEGLVDPSIKPKKIHAVRGPLTWERIKDLGVDCPPIFGDPACLMPLLYKPKSHSKRSLLGIIPHFYHLHSSSIRTLCMSENVKLISVFQKPEKFIDDLVSCEYIASSSLHGIILADAYNIPALWILPEDFVEKRGSQFKYHDYLTSVQSSQQEPFILTNTTKKAQIIDHAKNIKKSKISMSALLSSCPFKKGDFNFKNPYEEP